MRRLATAAAIIGAFALQLHAQPPAVTGRVIADDGDAIPRARLSIITPQGTTTMRADEQGRFTLAPAPGGSRLVATKFGYARTEITLKPGRPIEIRMPRAVVISGRVIDEFGEPAPSVSVTAERPGRSVNSANLVAETVTDDLGEYRLAGLAPGVVALWAETMRTDMPTRMVNGTLLMMGSMFGRMYYPGVTTPDRAEALALKAGEDRTGIDFVVRGQRPLAAGQALGLPPPAAAGGSEPSPQTAPRPTGVLRGHVFGADGRAIPHATVRLLPVPPTGGVPFVSVIADDTGSYELTDLAPSTYRLIASKAGFSPIRTDDPASMQPPFGSTREIPVGDGETRDHVDVRLARWVTLSGRIVDEIGDPLPGASVELLRLRYQAGRRRLVGTVPTSRLTDDLGRYRLFGVAPGNYIVSASVGAVASADLPGYARSYFPGTPNAGEAQFVSVGQSQDVVGTDFAMSLVRTGRIAGTLFNAEGEPTAGGSLRLLSSARSTAAISVPVGARILGDGRFEFPNVPPGQYVIQADRGRRQPSVEGEFGALAITFNGEDLTDVIVQMSAGSSISGRFTFESYDPSKLPPSGNVELVPAPVDFDTTPQSVATAAVADDWTFEMSGINGPRRLSLPRPPVGWMLKEIRVNGIDVTDRPLPFGTDEQSLTDVEVVLTDRVSGVSGTVTDAAGRPASAVGVVLFAADRDRWYPQSRFVRYIVARSDGAFAFTGLPAGTYYAAAFKQLPSELNGAWQDPEFLETLTPSATTVTMRDGETQSLAMKISR